MSTATQMEICKNNEEEMRCRICHETGTEDEPLLAPCKCKGSIKHIHNNCLNEWISKDKNPQCELCHYKFKFKKVFVADAPRTIPFKLILKDSCAEIYQNIKWTFCHLMLLAKIVLICVFNAKILPIESDDVQILIGFLLIMFNLMHYTIYKTVKKIINRFYDLSNSFSLRINPEETLQYTGTALSVTLGQRANEMLQSAETESEGELDDTTYYRGNIGRFIHNPFNLIINIQLFCRTCVFASIIGASRILDRYLISNIDIEDSIASLINIISKKINIKTDTKLFSRIMGLFNDYQCFLHEQKVFYFIKLYSINLFIFSMMTLCLWLIKISTSNYNLKKPFCHCKVYLVTSLSSAYLFCVEGTLCTFIVYKLNNIPYNNGVIQNSPFYNTCAVMFYNLLGYFMFRLVKDIIKLFKKNTRVGLYVTSVSDSNKNLLNQAIRCSIIKSIGATLITMGSLCIFVLILFNNLMVFHYKTNAEMYFMTMLTLTILKSRDKMASVLFNVYFIILKGISSVFNLDNYLFGKKLIKFNKNMLIWESNKNKNLKKDVAKANRLKNIDLDMNSYDYLNETSESTHYLNSTYSTLFKSGMTNRDKVNSMGFNSTINNSGEENSKYLINTRRFIKYFGRKHKRSLTIVYKPKYTWFVLNCTRLLCLAVTKLFIYTLIGISKYAGNAINKMIESKTNISISDIGSWSIFVLLIKVVIDSRNIVKNMSVAIYTHVWSPLIITLCLVISQSRVIHFSTAFYLSSIVTSIGFYLVKTLLFINGEISATTTLRLMVSLTCSIVMGLFVWNTCNIKHYLFILKIFLTIYLARHFVKGMQKIFASEFLNNLKEKYYLKEKIVMNYGEEQ